MTKTKVARKAKKTKSSPKESDLLLSSTVNKTKSVLSKHHHRFIKLMIFVSLFLVIVIIYWQTPVSWLMRSELSNTKTYPSATIFGESVGDLTPPDLETKLQQIESTFSDKHITLTNNNESWSFNYAQLGATFDSQATAQKIIDLNKMNLIDKYKLLAGHISSTIEPVIIIDENICQNALSIISIPEINPKDALIYFDQTIKLQSSQIGEKFSATSNCREMSSWLAKNIETTNVYLDQIKANLTDNDLQSKLPEINSIVGKSITLKSGSYIQTIDSKQLLALLTVSKDKTGVHIDWSSSKLDNLVNNIAKKVDTFNSTPTLGSCQYLISAGGNWLDKNSTKSYIKSLTDSSSRTYNLPMTYHSVAIGNRTKVPVGKNGTVYLTFDDGMTYGNQIMNYAACYGVYVTFFEIGAIANSDATQLKRAIAEGHSVQAHGYEHAAYDYGTRSYDWQYKDIKKSIEVITSVTGVKPTYFRPPGGNRSDNTYKAADANKVSLVLWGVSSRDATPGGLSSSSTCSNALAGVFSGATILMHSTHYSTAEAVPCIIEGLAARGYNMYALR